MNPIINVVQQKVTTEMNQSLLRPYSVEEVREALFLMQPMKAPGLDGMSPIFFQKYRHIVGEKVYNTVLSILHKCMIPMELNE